MVGASPSSPLFLIVFLFPLRLALVGTAAFFIASTASRAEAQRYLDPKLPPDVRVADLLPRMTLEEKVGQMNLVWTSEPVTAGSDIRSDGEADVGVQSEGNAALEKLEKAIRAGLVGSNRGVDEWQEANRRQRWAEASRLKIPLFIVRNGIHGTGQPGSTIFPSPISMASSWDLDLVRKAAAITARECRMLGYNWNFSPTVDVARDARWGRFGETFGEDPYLCGEMGAAMVEGYQGRMGKDNVIACAKHFAGGGRADGGVNFAPLDMGERNLRAYFLPPFKRAIDAGAWSVMAAHNTIDGIPCHVSEFLLTEVLRDEWKFKGFVVTDWLDLERLVTLHKVAAGFDEAYCRGVLAGVDVHNFGSDFVGIVSKMVRSGLIPEGRIDDSTRRILTAKFTLGLFENRYVDDPGASGVIGNEEARQLALDLARRSVVLLTNRDALLPLDGGRKLKVFVTGPNAESNAMLDDWILDPDPSARVVYPAQGMQRFAPAGVTIDYLACGPGFDLAPSLVAEAARRAGEADVAVLFLGGNHYRGSGMNPDRTGGENHDRQSIELSGNQLELARSVRERCKRLVIVLIDGRPAASEWLAGNADALLQSWGPGMMGGQAIAEIIYGVVNPSGKLVASLPRTASQPEVWYNHEAARYFRPYIDGKTGPAFAFGEGLSYTTFAYSSLTCNGTARVGAAVPVSVGITNTGKRKGDEVVQLYLRDEVSSVATPVRKLVGFQRVSLEPGESRKVSFTISPDQLALRDGKMRSVIEPGFFQVAVGGLEARFRIEE